MDVACVLIKLYFLKQARIQVLPVVCGFASPEWLNEAWGSGWVGSTEHSGGGMACAQTLASRDTLHLNTSAGLAHRQSWRR